MGFVFRNHVRWQDAAPEYVRVNHRAASENAAGVEHGVAAGFRAVAQQRAELAQARVERHAVHLDSDVAGEKFEVGNLHARAEVRLVAEDGVADVIEVRRLRAVEKQGVFQLGRIADDAAFADDDVFTDVGVVTDLAVLADDGRAFDHDAVFENRAFTDENVFADEGAAFALVPQLRFQVRGNISFNFLERVPREFAIGKNRDVFGLRQVKQVFSLEHGEKLKQISAPAKGNGVALPFAPARFGNDNRAKSVIFCTAEAMEPLIVPVAQMDRAVVS